MKNKITQISLNLKAIFFGLQSSVCTQNTHLKVLTDKKNVVHTIINMGSRQSLSCKKMAQDIWSQAAKNNDWFSVTFIPGVENAIADAESREYELRTELQLNPAISKFIVEMVNVTLVMDLFVCRFNYQLKPFASFWPAPEAPAVGAFTFS